MNAIDYIYSMFRTVEQYPPMLKMLEISLSQFGVQEWSGKKHNPEVMKYFEECGFSTIKDDETSWCSAAMCWCAMKAEIPHTNNLTARSWMKWGVEGMEPRLGDIVVYWRGDINGWQGHVGQFIRRDGDSIFTLGGNQSNEFNITDYSAHQLLGFRRYGN